MQLTELTATSPIDGRYRKVTTPLSNYFSEYALIKYRVFVEVEYFIALSNAKLPQLKPLSSAKTKSLRSIVSNFSSKNAQEIKDIEKVTNHDVKAVEYFLKKEFDKIGLSKEKEFVHFGLTSQDINNTAVPLSIKHAVNEVVLPKIGEVVQKLSALKKAWLPVSMLAHTHGQPASPTKLGKEIAVFIERLEAQLQQLRKIDYCGKFGGATGNFNAHAVAYPATNWEKFATTFLNRNLQLKRLKYTTQIEHYDNMAALFDCLKRINTILLDLNKDFWQYISMGYFKQKINKNEVGSSAMPHKVNPIDFENSEGNLGIANALFEHLSAKLPVSRLQRDLTDSTVTRAIGVPFAHTLIAYESLLKGLGKIELNKPTIDADLEKNWVVVAEAIQTILRREGFPKPYEALKELTRSTTQISQKEIHQFVKSLAIKDSVRKELLSITPFNYTGIF
ncbi:MAG: adenylosuccinate lyase [Bacteroidetes bacterium]|nr:adenylosuccinate lyase [Bacteroidota bacterium]